MASYFKNLWNKPKLESIDDQFFLKIEFLTKQEKVQKNIALQRLQKNKPKEEDGQIVLPNTDNQYKASFRGYVEFPGTSQIRIAKVLEMIETMAEPQLEKASTFYNDNVQEIELILHCGKVVTRDDVIKLMDFNEKLWNDSGKILQFVYKKKGFFSRMKTVAKKTIVSIPGMFMRFLSGLISRIVGWFGLSSITSTIFKSIFSTKQVRDYLLTIVTMFFPMLAPLLGIAKFI